MIKTQPIAAFFIFTSENSCIGVFNSVTVVHSSYLDEEHDAIAAISDSH